MRVVYTGEEFPQSFTHALFLAGPVPRDRTTCLWRDVVLESLRRAEYDGVVYYPMYRPESNQAHLSYTEQVEWEMEAMRMSDRILFWINRDSKNLGLTTNVEFGKQVASGKVMYGWPETAKQVRYIKELGDKYNLSQPAKDVVVLTLSALEEWTEIKTKGHHPRLGGERYVPYYIWKQKHFQDWFQTNPHGLHKADLLWVYLVGKNHYPLAWAMEVELDVVEEGRLKKEFILTRTNPSVICAYRWPDLPSGELTPSIDDIDKIEVVFIKEVRCPANNRAGYSFTLPGGSTFKDNNSARTVMYLELAEELGLDWREMGLSKEQIFECGPNQGDSIFSTHRYHLFGVEMTNEQMSKVRGQVGKKFGNEAETEVTYPLIMTVGDARKSGLVDNNTLGMLYTAIFGN